MKTTNSVWIERLSRDTLSANHCQYDNQGRRETHEHCVGGAADHDEAHVEQPMAHDRVAGGEQEEQRSQRGEVRVLVVPRQQRKDARDHDRGDPERAESHVEVCELRALPRRRRPVVLGEGEYQQHDAAMPHATTAG